MFAHALLIHDEHASGTRRPVPGPRCASAVWRDRRLRCRPLMFTAAVKAPPRPGALAVRARGQPPLGGVVLRARYRAFPSAPASDSAAASLMRPAARLWLVVSVSGCPAPRIRSQSAGSSSQLALASGALPFATTAQPDRVVVAAGDRSASWLLAMFATRVTLAQGSVGSAGALSMPRACGRRCFDRELHHQLRTELVDDLRAALVILDLGA